MKLSAFTIYQQNPEFSQDTLPYSTISPNLSKLIVHCCKLLGFKTLSWNDMCYRITKTVKP